MESHKLSELTRIVRDHQVVYEVWPVRVPHPNGLRTIGYDLTLVGTHEHPLEPLTPGCRHCMNVWDRLRRIAQSVLPVERGSTFEVRPFDSSLHFDKHRGMRADVELVVEIRHKENYSAPADRCEEDCLAVLIDNLKDLGVRGGP